MRIFSIVSLLAFAILGSLLSSNKAQACSCNPAPRDEIVSFTDFVFVGRVQKVRVIGNKRHAWVKALRKIKGDFSLPHTFELVTEIDGGLCGYDFRTDSQRITFGADEIENGDLYVNSCTMYGLAKSDADIEKVDVENLNNTASDSSSDLTSASCFAQNSLGFAECAAICPAGQNVLNCTHSAGNLSSGDTCKSLSRVFSGGTDSSGQPNPQPHNQCTVSAMCSNSNQTLSVQGWATCYQP